jgi:hypothetical protein
MAVLLDGCNLAGFMGPGLLALIRTTHRGYLDEDSVDRGSSHLNGFSGSSKKTPNSSWCSSGHPCAMGFLHHAGEPT